jgi:hypothetical protein
VITVRTGRGLLIGVLIGILALVASCGDTEETTLPKAPSSAQTQSEKPLEHKLADLNAGYYVEKNDPSIARFRYLLLTIEAKTSNSQQQIADMTVWAQNDLKESYGKNVKLLELMEAANDSIPTGVKMKYQEILAALIILLAS